MTLNMTIPKTQNPGAADSLTQQGGGEGEERDHPTHRPMLDMIEDN